MKHLIAFLVWMTACPVWAGGNPYVLGCHANTSNCTTESESKTGGTYDLWIDTVSRRGVSTRWTASKSYKMCSISLTVKRGESVTNTATVSIYSGETTPSSLIETSSVQLTTSNTTTSYQNIIFPFNNVNISSGSKYHVVLMTNGPTAYNYSIRISDSGTESSFQYDGSTWLTGDSSITCEFVSYE